MSSQFDKKTKIWFRFEHIFILQNYNCQWAQAQKLRAPSPLNMVTLPAMLKVYHIPVQHREKVKLYNIYHREKVCVDLSIRQFVSEWTF